VPVWYWAGGAMGGVLLCVIAVLIIRMGAASFTAIVLAGQIFGGLLIAHYGLMDTPAQHLTPVRILGALLMALGATMAVLGKVPGLG
ncbi:MAG: DMT family transporter, partial [Kiritimatiellia bacterium]